MKQLQPPGDAIIASERSSSPMARTCVQVRTDGLLTAHAASLIDAVFLEPVDHTAWARRMLPGQSWLLTTRHGFLAAHRRNGMVSVWLAGVASEGRGTGEFRALVSRLLCEVGLTVELTMTTRPHKFEKMFAILTRFARRCDEPDDAAAGKARFHVDAWVVFIALHRRAALTVLVLCCSIAASGAVSRDLRAHRMLAVTAPAALAVGACLLTS